MDGSPQGRGLGEQRDPAALSRLVNAGTCPWRIAPPWSVPIVAKLSLGPVLALTPSSTGCSQVERPVPLRIQSNGKRSVSILTSLWSLPTRIIMPAPRTELNIEKSGFGLPAALPPVGDKQGEQSKPDDRWECDDRGDHVLHGQEAFWSSSWTEVSARRTSSGLVVFSTCYLG